MFNRYYHDLSLRIDSGASECHKLLIARMFCKGHFRASQCDLYLNHDNLYCFFAPPGEETIHFNKKVSVVVGESALGESPTHRV